MLILNAAHKFSATETFHVARPDYLHKKNSGNCWDQNQLSWWLRVDWKWFGHVDCKNDGQLVTGKWHQIFCQLVQEFWSLTTTYISHSHWVVALTTVMCYTMHRITINTEREQIRLIYILWTQGWCTRDSTFAPSPQTYTTAAFREGRVREGANVSVCQTISHKYSRSSNDGGRYLCL